jgi:branched-chain amino acid transport system ATP-binding protein
MATDPPPALALDDVHGGWSGTTVIEGVSFAVRAGETVAIIGRNGVGKTTLFEIIVGRAQHHGGSIRLDGAEIASLPVHRRNARGLGFVPQEREVFPSLTVLENLAVATRPGHWDRERVLDLFPRLASRAQALAGHLSGGEQQMLSIGRALMGNPTVLLMDEPSEGLAPIVVDQLVAAIERMVSERSLTVLLIEQRIEIALALSERCVVVDRGRIVFDGASAPLRGDEQRLGQLLGLRTLP